MFLGLATDSPDGAVERIGAYIENRSRLATFANRSQQDTHLARRGNRS